MDNISYDLAKRLKDAGFPYKPTRLHFDGSVETPPTLEELIDACGESFDALLLQKTEQQKFADGKQWVAMQSRFDGGVEDLPRGSTPLEAVANLWLALNEK